MKPTTIIKFAKPFFIRNGKPTKIVRSLRNTEGGEAILQALLSYYITHTDFKIRIEEIDDNVDINKYKWNGHA